MSERFFLAKARRHSENSINSLRQAYSAPYLCALAPWRETSPCSVIEGTHLLGHPPFGGYLQFGEEESGRGNPHCGGRDAGDA